MLVGMYMGKTLKGNEDKQRKMMKIAVDVLILVILFILLVGVYLFLIEG